MRTTIWCAVCLVLSMGLGSVASQVNAQEICRTAGFWGTHAGEERSGSTNISEEVIRAWLSTVNSYDQTATDKCTYEMDGTVICNFEPPGQAGSPKACRDAKKNDITLLNNFPIGYEGMDICGQIISVDPNGPDQIPPVVEALCVSPGGDSKLQLGRQLTAAALNCLLSGGGSDCKGTSIEPVFAACNSTCVVSGQEDQVNTCIEKLDCFNNGGAWNEDDPQAMYCQMDVADSCHDQLLIGTVMRDSGEPGDPELPPQ